MEFGLGGINPNIKYKNLELLQYLSLECEKKIPDNKEYLVIRDASLGMANQKPVEFKTPDGGTFIGNYEHKNIYVGLTLERAIIYACDNKYGSEILEYCIKLFEFLKENDSSFNLPEELNLFNIEKYINKEHKPILIEINEINENELETEFGKNGTEYLANLRKTLPTLNEMDFHRKLGYSNFRLLKPIESERLKIYEVDFEGRVGTQEFEFTMTEIKAST
ncbi:hypothetical protein Q4595_15880 [Wenyingzhuangia sp. 1_MG-2023]|jgi:hypothetical protein|nr:hypothetical protein [Wenyingzhuangia sp. 1_MG-2023]